MLDLCPPDRKDKIQPLGQASRHSRNVFTTIGPI